MPVLKFEQFQYETDSWKRILDFMMEENIHLKNRLSVILSDRFNNKLLDDVELFHNSFIREDDIICLLRNNLAELDNQLLLNDVLLNHLDVKFEKLRADILCAEIEFGKLKLDFNSFLSVNL